MYSSGYLVCRRKPFKHAHPLDVCWLDIRSNGRIHVGLPEFCRSVLSIPCCPYMYCLVTMTLDRVTTMVIAQIMHAMLHSKTIHAECAYSAGRLMGFFPNDKEVEAGLAKK